MKLLHIDSSILGGYSVSRDLSALIVQHFSGPGVEVIYRDLAIANLPHVTPTSIPTAHSLSAAARQLDAAGEKIRKESDEILREFLDADTVVLGVPMYNFTIPSQLKAWIDRIVIPGTTVRYSENGPEGLVGDKRIVVAIARGGFYGADTAMASAEHAESYLKLVFGFLGVTDIEFVLAEGLNRGEESKTNALASARKAVQQLAA